MLLPYGQLTFVTITRILKDPEVDAIFGKGAPPALADMPALPAGEKASAEAAPAEEPPPAVEPAKKPAAVSKSALVAKLRDRLKDK